MAVVGDHRGATEVHDVEAAGRGLGIGHEADQAGADGVPVHADGPRGRDRGHHVLDLEADGAATREGHLVEMHVLAPGALRGHQAGAIRPLLEVDGAAALCAMRAEHGVGAVGGEEDDLARAGRRHLGDFGVGGIQHRVTRGGDVLDDDALEHGHVLHGGDVVQPKVVALADVGDHGHGAVVEAQALAQHAAARGLQHRGLHLRVHQHVARALRAAAIAAVDLAAVDVNPVGVGHAHGQPGAGQQVRDHPCDGGLAVGAGDGDDGDAAVVTGRVQVGDDGLADGAPLAVGRRQVHAQPGGRVDFHDAAALGFQRFQHALADHVHAADVQAHHPRRGHGPCRDLGVDVVGDVGGGAAGGEIGVVAQSHAAPLLRDRGGRQALELQPGPGDVVDADAGQRAGVAIATPRVGVDLLDQLLDGVLAVADDMGRVAPGRGDEPVADHEHAEVVSGQEFLDHHRADLGGGAVGDLEVLACADVDGDTLALVAVLRLEHHGQPDLLGDRPGFLDAAHRLAPGHGHTCGLQQFLGQVLVLRDGLADSAGGVHLGRPDPALLHTPAELHQAAIGQAAPGDVAGDGGIDDGAGAGTQADVFVDGPQRRQGRGGVERRALGGRVEQRLGLLEGMAPDGFLGVLHHHLVDAGLDGDVRAAEADLAAGRSLQGQHRELQHLGLGFRAHDVRGPVFADAGEQGADAGFELGGDAVLRGIAETAHEGLDRRVAGPEVGAAKGPQADDFHRSVGVFGWGAPALRQGVRRWRVRRS